MPTKQAFPKVAIAQQGFCQPRKHPKMFRVGLYARVSTHDQQTLPLQIRAMREYAARRGWSLVRQIKEVGSGAVATGTARNSDRSRTPARNRCRAGVATGSRWGRSVADLVSTPLRNFSISDVGFVSLTEAIDLDHTRWPRDGPAYITGHVFAEFEREIRCASVSCAGLAHARLSESQRLGRPPSVVHKAVEARKLHRQGSSKSEIARRLQISRTLGPSPLASKRNPDSDRLTQPCRKDTTSTRSSPSSLVCSGECSSGYSSGSSASSSPDSPPFLRHFELLE